MKKSHSIVAALDLLMLALFAVRAAAQTADIPRAEYPRPQFTRANWLNLNGEWEFQWDAADVGLREGWYRGERRLAKRIVVPFAFQTRMSGIGYVLPERKAAADAWGYSGGWSRRSSRP